MTSLNMNRRIQTFKVGSTTFIVGLVIESNGKTKGGFIGMNGQGILGTFAVAIVFDNKGIMGS